MNFCYRHPEREASVRCQRCERNICWECQIPNAVGVLCPEDGRVRAVKQVRLSNRPSLTIGLIALNAVLYLGQILSAGSLTSWLIYSPLLTKSEPWRMLTAGFIHSETSFMHIILNMYSLYVLGSSLEPVLGKAKFAMMYLFSILGGSVAVLLLASPQTTVLGASGGIFGLMGGFFIILRSMGQSSGQMTSIIAINLVFGFLPGTNISWQAHVGGLVVGGIVAFIYSKTRYSSEAGKQKLMLGGLAAGLLALTVYGVSLLPVIGF